MAILPCSTFPADSMASPEFFGPKRAFLAIPEWMIWEILTWVPTKSLMRFKAVSKLWLSIIQDPNFAKARQVPFRGVLITDPHPCMSPYVRESPRSFLFANLDSSNPQASLQLSVPDDLLSFGVTNAVNGLVCFYDRAVAKLCNIATHEIKELPVSRCAYKFCTYHFGFDSVNNLYKLLKICPLYYDEESYDLDSALDGVYVLSMECEILTLGVDSSWRSISRPPWAIREQCLCINGVLYWLIEDMDYRKQLRAFNLSREKFEVIPLPPEPYGLRLPQFTTSLALIGGDDGRLEIKHYDEESARWTKTHIFSLPWGWKEALGPLGILPNGKVVIADWAGIQVPTIIYLYDETKRDLQHIVLSRCPKLSAQLSGSGKISCFEENIISLRCLVDPLQH